MNTRFTVTDHNYFNSGGNCMVSIFTVFDKKNKAVRYVIANDEGCNYQVLDTVGHEPPDDINWDDILLGSYDWHKFTIDSLRELDIDYDEFELLKYCQFEFYKKYCKDFGIMIELHVDELTDELFKSITYDAVLWHREAGAYVKTDGERVLLDDLYVVYCEQMSVKDLDDVKRFKVWYDGLLNADTIDALSDTYITIAVAGNSVKIPWNADNYDAISTLLTDVIKEW